MRFFRTSILATALALFATGCSSDSNNGGGSSEWSVLSSVKSGTSRFDALMADSSTVGVSGFNGALAAASSPSFNDAWDDTSFGILDPRDSSDPNVSVQDFLGLMLDENKTRDNGSSFNLFGRLQSPIQIACALSAIVGVGADGYPANTASTQTLTFTAANSSTMTSVCGMADAPTAGESILYDVESASGTYYDKKITLRLSWGATTDRQYFYMKNTATALNILSTEYYDLDWDGSATTEAEMDGMSRSVVFIDKSTNTVRFEYLATGDSNQLEFHRGFYSGSTGIARLMSFNANAINSTITHNSNMGDRFVIVGYPEDSSKDVALSFAMDRSGQAGGNYDYTDFTACVNPNTGAIVTDGADLTSACDAVGVTDNSATIFATAFAKANAVDVSTEATAGADLIQMVTDSDDTTVLSFDASDFHTLGLSNW